jgi:predicted Rossmann fold nucleotide-binding protein DprA/Smf involved in DNA uptake
VRITITGTRDVPEAAGDCQALFEWMRPYAAAGHGFFVGGAVGIDTLALGWLVSRRAPVTVVVPATVEDQPAAACGRIRQAERAGLAEVVELHHPGFPEAEAFHARNRYMVDRSQFVVGYPLSGRDGGGTWDTLEYAASKGLPRLIVPVPSQPPG